MLTGTAAPASEGELAAVLSALAGVRRGDAVAAVGAGRITRGCLAAGAGQPLLDEASQGPVARVVVVVGDEAALAAGLRLLAPGGRLVGLAPGRHEAARTAGAAGLVLRHVEAVGDGVAWSAVRPLAP